MTARRWNILLCFMAGACFGLAVVLPGCTGQQKQIATGILDVSGAICEELQKQPEPEAIQFLCSVVDIAGNVTTFLAKVKREDAASFAARHCPQEGSAAP